MIDFVARNTETALIVQPRSKKDPGGPDCDACAAVLDMLAGDGGIDPKEHRVGMHEILVNVEGEGIHRVTIDDGIIVRCRRQEGAPS